MNQTTETVDTIENLRANTIVAIDAQRADTTMDYSGTFDPNGKNHLPYLEIEALCTGTTRTWPLRLHLMVGHEQATGSICILSAGTGSPLVPGRPLVEWQHLRTVSGDPATLETLRVREERAGVLGSGPMDERTALEVARAVLDDDRAMIGLIDLFVRATTFLDATQS